MLMASPVPLTGIIGGLYKAHLKKEHDGVRSGRCHGP